MQNTKNEIEETASVEALLHRATTRYYDRKYEEVVSDCNKVLEIDPNSIDGYILRGKAKGNLNQNFEAITDFNDVLDLDDTNTEAYYYRGIAKGMLNRPTEAIEDFDKSIGVCKVFVQVMNWKDVYSFESFRLNNDIWFDLPDF